MYDYIIVGAGSAGCVLANRLTEDPQTSVLLIEAGGSDKKQEIHIPAAFSKLFKTSYDWAYFTEEEPQMANRKLYWPRGKVLGGSSSINAMIYIRGNHYDYDSWRDEGNEGWGYADVLPYFKKGENQERGPSEYHGTGGPLNVSDRRYTNPLSLAFVEACKELNIPANDDFNGATQEGAGLFQVTQKNGTRWSTVDAYLKPALGRKNLTVQINTQVARIEIALGRATGITYLMDGKSETVRANREVLICGGAINSPQLLLLSGIGPADDLKALNIPVMDDLPGVGQNLQDHLASGVSYQSTQPISLNDAEKTSNVIHFLFRKRGPLTSNIAESGAFVTIQKDAPAPDIQFHFAPIFFMNHGLDPIPGHGFTIGPTLLHPRSRGRIALRSNDPLAHPTIQANYLKEEEDTRVMLQAIRLSHDLARTRAFDSFRGSPVLGGPDLNDEETLQLIREHSETLYHPVGTCKMGNDPLAVVDNQLRVHGIEGLRVIDASIMPTVPSGNTNAPTIMIAEKIADLLKQVPVAQEVRVASGKAVK
jgi:choline dehydrogenase